MSVTLMDDDGTPPIPHPTLKHFMKPDKTSQLLKKLYKGPPKGLLAKLVNSMLTEKFDRSMGMKG